MNGWDRLTLQALAIQEMIAHTRSCIRWTLLQDGLQLEPTAKLWLSAFAKS